MDFKLSDSERKVMIEVLTGKTLVQSCKENACSYDRMSKNKNVIFPQFKSKRKFTYKEAEANNILDYALDLLKNAPAEIGISSEPPLISPESLEAMRKHVAAESEIDPITPIYVDLSPLRRLNQEAFFKVMQLADAARTIESASEFLKAL